MIGQSGPEQDGILTAMEMTGFKLRGTQLVALSACQTGLGELALGKDCMACDGLWYWQVISLWKVDDEATQALMVTYYEQLQSGSNRDMALRQTQLEFLQDSEYEHPYYWAAFIDSGDWRPLTLK